jgi:hypothetical protein
MAFMKRFIKILTVFSFCFLAAGCVTRLGSFTVLSTKNIDWSRAAAFQRMNERVTGEDMYHIIVIIPTKGNASIEEAVDQAIESVPGGVALIDVVVSNKYFYIPYIYGKSGYVVEGTVLIDPQLALDDSGEQKFYTSFTEDGETYTTVLVTEEEYNKQKKKYL